MLSPLLTPAAEAALRLAARASPAGGAHLYLAGPRGRLAVAARVGSGPDLAAVAETLGTDAVALDLSAVAPATPRAVGVAWGGMPRGAVLLTAVEPMAGDALERLRDAVGVLRPLVAPRPPPAPRPADARATPIARIAHDIRGPLTAILGYTELLHAAVTPDEIAELRAVVLRAGDAMMAGIDRLSALAVAESGRVTMAPTRPLAAVHHLAASHQSTATRRGTAFSLQTDLPDEPLLLDAALFRHLVRTLVGAAVTATVGGQIDARLSLDGRHLVFDLHAAPAEAGAGLGPIGADLVHHLTALLGGTVEPPGPDDAWRWTVRLPARPVPVVTLAPVAPGAGPGADEPVAQAALAVAG